MVTIEVKIFSTTSINNSIIIFCLFAIDYIKNFVTH